MTTPCDTVVLRYPNASASFFQTPKDGAPPEALQPAPAGDPATCQPPPPATNLPLIKETEPMVALRARGADVSDGPQATITAATTATAPRIRRFIFHSTRQMRLATANAD